MADNEVLGTGAVVWNLDDLYLGADDPALRRDMELVESRASALAGQYRDRVGSLQADELLALVRALEEVDTLLARLAAFAFLNFIVRTGDAAASALLQEVEELSARVGRRTVFFRLEWNSLDETRALALLDAPTLAGYRHYLAAMRRFAPHQLSRAEEELLQELGPVGRSAWNVLFEKLMGRMRFGEEGRSEEEVLSDL